jgi:hypothetical protein
MALTSEDALNGRDFASLAWGRVHKAIYAAAIKNGLKEIKGYYGLSEEGQFLVASK